MPTVTEALCRDGVVGDAALSVGPTDFITYSFSADPPYSEGQSVTITATLDPAGVEWGALGAWTELTDTTAELVVTFDEVDCLPASLVDPGVDQATCAEGVVTVPTVTPRAAESTGVVYTVDPAGPYDGTADIEVLVTATVVNDYGWGQLPLGWTRVDAATATFTVNLVGGVV